MTEQLRKQLESLIEENGLGKYRAEILNSVKPSARLVSASSKSGRSKLGGSPLLPPHFDWPTSEDGEPLTCIAQLDLAELEPVLRSELPTHGLLTFFYDVENLPSGSPADHSGWRVYWFENSDELQQSARVERVLTERRVRFTPDITIPSYRSHDILKLKNSKEEEAYWDVRDALAELGDPSFGPMHRVDGHPDADRYPLADELKAEAQEWRLLLQIDSDDDMDMSFDDTGRLFLWLHSADLKKRDFSKTWLYLYLPEEA